MDGKPLWTAGDDASSYSSPTLLTLCGSSADRDRQPADCHLPRSGRRAHTLAARMAGQRRTLAQCFAAAGRGRRSGADVQGLRRGQCAVANQTRRRQLVGRAGLEKQQHENQDDQRGCSRRIRLRAGRGNPVVHRRCQRQRRNGRRASSVTARSCSSATCCWCSRNRGTWRWSRPIRRRSRN